MLIVEDSKTINNFLKNSFESFGYSCYQAFTLKEALSLASGIEFDFITLDLHLPDGEGDELLESLSKKTSSKIIVLTAITDKDRRDLLFRNGVFDYFDKEALSKKTVSDIVSLIKRAEDNIDTSILVIDDSLIITKTIRRLLEIRGYCVFCTGNGKDGLKALDANKIDLIIIDIELPDIRGTKLLEIIKSDFRFEMLPALMLSSTTDPAIIGDTLKNGAADFLRKPYIAEELIRKVDFWIDYRKKSDKITRADKILSEYKKAVDNSAIVSKTDKNGLITFVNDKFCEISGYPLEELIGKPHSIVRHQDMSSKVFEELWAAIMSKKIWRGVIKNRKKDKTAYIAQSTITPILDENGEIVEFISVSYDITQLEELKDELQSKLGGIERNLNETLEITAQYEIALDEANMIVKTDPNGIIMFANDRFCEVSGYQISELIGETHAIVQHKDTKKEAVKKLWKTIKQGEIYKGAIKNRRKNGLPFWIETIIKPITMDGVIIEYLQISNDITEAISLHEELEDTQRELIYRFGEIGETRNKETGRHVKRVAEYSKLLAQKYGLSEEDSQLVFVASPMHDIGKVGIADSVLLKPSKLDDGEFEIMKTHAEIGARVLSGSKRKIIEASAIIAAQHHEKYNGKGYPKGLKGDKIHIFGRIVAIADVFDALGSDRPYKKAWGVEKILELFHKERGEHFDPLLTDIFLNNFADFLAIRNRYSDEIEEI
ncbi:MAG TPA: response regulator [Campylobacterales bacterium]|nr:response regulator [Campylobacterales bacterium]